MKLTDKQRTLRRAAWLGTYLILFFSLAGLSSLSAAPLLPRAELSGGHRADLQQVLSVVEQRTTDGKVLDKMREKLSLLGERELHLAASLCERIARDERSAGANIAFTIVTAMIVLS